MPMKAEVADRITVVQIARRNSSHAPGVKKKEKKWPLLFGDSVSLILIAEFWKIGVALALPKLGY